MSLLHPRQQAEVHELGLHNGEIDVRFDKNCEDGGALEVVLQRLKDLLPFMSLLHFR